MECSVSPLERPKIAKHWDRCCGDLKRRKKGAEVKLDGAEQKDRSRELVNVTVMPFTVFTVTERRIKVLGEHQPG